MITIPLFILVLFVLVGAVLGFLLGSWMTNASCEDRVREMGRQVEVFRQRWIAASSNGREDVDQK